MPKRITLTLFSALLFASALPALGESATTATTRPPILGTWKGTLKDPQVGEPYTATVRVKRDGTKAFKGTTAYDNIDCAGKLKGKKVSKGHYRFTETITENTDFCGERWTIKVTIRRHHRSDWYWSNAEGNTASGRLKLVQ